MLLRRQMTVRGRAPTGPGHSKIVAGLVVFAGVMSLVPLLLHKRHMRLQQGAPMIASEKPLNPTAVPLSIEHRHARVNAAEAPRTASRCGAARTSTTARSTSGRTRIVRPLRLR